MARAVLYCLPLKFDVDLAKFEAMVDGEGSPNTAANHHQLPAILQSGSAFVRALQRRASLRSPEQKRFAANHASKEEWVVSLRREFASLREASKAGEGARGFQGDPALDEIAEMALGDSSDDDPEDEQIEDDSDTATDEMDGAADHDAESGEEEVGGGRPSLDATLDASDEAWPQQPPTAISSYPPGTLTGPHPPLSPSRLAALGPSDSALEPEWPSDLAPELLDEGASPAWKGSPRASCSRADSRASCSGAASLAVSRAGSRAKPGAPSRPSLPFGEPPVIDAGSGAAAGFGDSVPSPPPPRAAGGGRRRAQTDSSAPPTSLRSAIAPGVLGGDPLARAPDHSDAPPARGSARGGSGSAGGKRPAGGLLHRRASAPNVGDPLAAATDHLAVQDELGSKELLRQRLRKLNAQESKGAVLLTYVDRVPTEAIVEVATEELDKYLYPDSAEAAARPGLLRRASANKPAQLRSLKSKQVAGLLEALGRLAHTADAREDAAVLEAAATQHAAYAAKLVEKVGELEGAIEQQRNSIRESERAEELQESSRMSSEL